MAAAGHGSDAKHIEFQCNCRYHHWGPALSVREQRITKTFTFRILAEQTYPHLDRLALKFFCTPVLSVHCERLFSKAGELVSKRQSRLGPNVIKNFSFRIKMGKTLVFPLTCTQVLPLPQALIYSKWLMSFQRVTKSLSVHFFLLHVLAKKKKMLLEIVSLTSYISCGHLLY